MMMWSKQTVTKKRNRQKGKHQMTVSWGAILLLYCHKQLEFYMMATFYQKDKRPGMLQKVTKWLYTLYHSLNIESKALNSKVISAVWYDVDFNYLFVQSLKSGVRWEDDVKQSVRMNVKSFVHYFCYAPW